MRKKLLKWFTLVEILIVIVIIGILIWALVPRMSAAQWRARDVARKNDLAQLQSAIVTSQQDKWDWPWMGSWAASWINISTVKKQLETAWMNSVPKDPLSSNIVTWLWTDNYSWGEYAYMVSKRNGTDNAGFVLMAKTEVEWWSNRVYCGSWKDHYADEDTSVWYIGVWEDLWKLHLCTRLTKNTNATSCTVDKEDGNCVYTEDWQLRYILLY